MKPMTLILIGAIIAILGGVIGAIGTWKQNKSSSEKSTRIETGVNKGILIGESTNQEVLKLRKENQNLIAESVELNRKNDIQISTIDALRKENIDLYTKLASSSLSIYNNLTGGDSYCYCFFLMSTHPQSKDTGSLLFKLGDNNKNPLKNVQARLFDINTYDKENPPIHDDLFKNLIDIKTIEVDGSVLIPTKFYLDKQKGVNLNIFYSANNGFFTQLLRMRFINNKWTSATIVMRNEKTIFKKIDENYPEKNSGKIFK